MIYCIIDCVYRSEYKLMSYDLSGWFDFYIYIYMTTDNKYI
jgi:hypothetical protein